MFCEDELKLTDLRTRSSVAVEEEKFSAIGRRFSDGRYEALLGEPIPAIGLSQEEQDHLRRGETVLVVSKDDSSDIILIRHFNDAAGSPGLLMGVVRGEYLWGIEKGNNLPPLTEFIVISATGQSLYRSFYWRLPTDALVHDASRKHARLRAADTDWLVADWSLFMKPKFASGNWSIVLLQPQDDVLAPIARFKIIFILVVVLALLLVVALSLFNLRRSLEPIDALKKGARRIAEKDFGHRVDVYSRDEFQDLAESFNSMSDQLGKQFRFLATQAEIDHATLSGKDFGHIAGLSIVRILKDFKLIRVGIGRVNAGRPDDALIYSGHRRTPDFITSHPFQVSNAHLTRFNTNRPFVVVDDPVEWSQFMPADFFSQSGTLILFPIRVSEKLFALLSVVCDPEAGPFEETLLLVRQIADHLAVAWSNVNLILDLRRLTTGSMQALARAVDAKSPWTAGHSTRVMRIAMGIGRHMELLPERIDRLEQAALLHDIGKIGVSSKILDKAGRLTDEEFDAIKRHPVIGEKILAPIPVFKPIIPMVRQHHERWDGKGYPDGLGGEAITLEARILAVADACDAMASDRPYRKGMDMARVIAIIESEAGRQFDPLAVAAFLKLMEENSALAA
jgi:HAMP domain-containing protein